MIRTMVLAAAPVAGAAVTVPPTPDFIRAAAATDEFERQAGRMAER